MGQKARVLFILPQKANRKKTDRRLGDFIEQEIPDVYEFLYSYGEAESLKMVQQYHPQIIFISHANLKNPLDLLKHIKSIIPGVQVFVFIPNTLSDEQKTIDEYMDAGAYKCLHSLFNIDTLMHDMFVSLHLE